LAPTNPVPSLFFFPCRASDEKEQSTAPSRTQFRVLRQICNLISAPRFAPHIQFRISGKSSPRTWMLWWLVSWRGNNSADGSRLGVEGEDDRSVVVEEFVEIGVAQPVRVLGPQFQAIVLVVCRTRPRWDALSETPMVRKKAIGENTLGHLRLFSDSSFNRALLRLTKGMCYKTVNIAKNMNSATVALVNASVLRCPCWPRSFLPAGKSFRAAFRIA
jgi:hypothetical protein